MKVILCSAQLYHRRSPEHRLLFNPLIRPEHCIPVVFWFVRFDVQRKMSEIEEKNVDIAGVASRLSDEETGHFPPQKVDKIERQGYN